MHVCAAHRTYVLGLFAEMSHGKVSFPRHLGKIVTVNVDDGRWTHHKNCKFWNIGLEADNAVRTTLGIEQVNCAVHIPQTPPTYADISFLICAVLLNPSTCKTGLL